MTSPTARPVDVDVDVSSFVEQFGLASAGAGLPRAAGRLLGWLMVCDPAEQTAADLAEVLRASTGGVSQNLKMLTQVRFVEKTVRPGDRRTFYRVAPGAWEKVITAQTTDAILFRRLGEQGLELLADASPQRRARLQELTDFYTFLEREMPSLLQRWSDQKGTSDE